MNRTEAHLFRACAVAFASAFIALPAFAQSPETTGSLRHEIFVSSQADNYLRYLQTVGKVPEHPWSSRGFSEREIRKLTAKDSASPWSD